MKHHIKKMLGYQQWARKRLLSNLANLNSDDFDAPLPTQINSIQKLLQHIYHFEHKLYKKIISHAEMPIENNELLLDKLNLLSSYWLTWLESENENKINQHTGDIITLCEHSTYHQTQIYTALKFLGHKAESLDIYLYQYKEQTA